MEQGMPEQESFIGDKSANKEKTLQCSPKFIQNCILVGMERIFYNHGKRVSRHPFCYIALCLAITFICGTGLIWFRQENNGIRLFIPEKSDQRINTDWLWDNFPNERRFASIIFVSSNDLLVPQVIQSMYNTRKSIDALKTLRGDTWSNMCIQVPIVKPPDIPKLLSFGKKRRKRDIFEDDFEDFDENFSKLSVSFDSLNFTNSVYIKAPTKSREKVPNIVIPNNTSESSNPVNNFEDFESDPVKISTLGQGSSEKTLANLGEYFSIEYYPEPYCDIVNTMPTVCLEMSILELWAHDGKYDETTDREIEMLTKESILDKINSVNKSGVYMMERNFSSLLGGIKYDSDGKIVGAEATIMRWFVKMNATEALLNPLVERDEPVDIRTLEFEGEMLSIMLNQSGYPEGLQSYPNVQRSFADVATVAVLGDITQLFVGYMIVFVYVMIMLGKFTCVEQRAYLSITSIIGIVMGIIVAYGSCSALGLFYGPMHNVLPFLLLGIGIDDMFVIVQSWESLDEKEKSGTLPEKFGRTLSHSGVAITITSLTDVLAFAIGGTTVLPALQSFCLYASVGIIAIYWFQCTFFVAWMSIDQRRIEQHRNGCCPCFKHTNYSQNIVAKKSISKTIFVWYGNILLTTPSKIFVFIVTLVITGVAIAGNLLLEQKFDPTWFLPPGTYLANWVDMNRKYFPFGGDRVTIWCHGVDYMLELDRLDYLAKTLSQQTDIIDNVDSWTTHFIDYLDQLNLPKYEQQLNPFNSNETLFREKLTQFFYSPKGSKYRMQFKHTDDPICGKQAPDILLSDITFRHRIFQGPSQQIPAMNRVKSIIKESNLTGRVFPLSLGYAAWETDEVIADELYRNLGLAILCIFITTVILVGQLVCSVLVLLMVVMSLADVGGFMHFWGLTIDTVSCINLIIAMGLCVDYSAHIAHRFLVENKGSREDRVKSALANIGPAVLNGGISTFLAFILLAGSESFVFSSFFKIFFLVVFFGLFQGLAVLPVLLSLFGPDSSTHDSVNQNGTMSHLATQSTFINNDNQDCVIQNGTLSPSATESNILSRENQHSVTENGIDFVTLKIDNHHNSATKNGGSNTDDIFSNLQINPVQMET